MQQNIAKLRKAFESGRINRRQLMQALGLTATAAFAASVSPEVTAFAGSSAQTSMPSGTILKAVAYNHINYQVSDYAKVRDFYVNLFGMKLVYDDGKQCSVECGDPPNAIYIRPLTRPLDRPAGTGRHWSAQMGTGNVDHFAFSIENFQLESVGAELKRRGLDPKPDGAYAWSIKDPSGITLQICATRGVFPGAASPTAKESDGTKNLSSDPRARRQGFQSVRREPPGCECSRCGQKPRFLHRPAGDESNLLQAGRCVRRGCGRRSHMLPEIRREHFLPSQEPASRK